jgi:hypothetical protein
VVKKDFPQITLIFADCNFSQWRNGAMAQWRNG